MQAKALLFFCSSYKYKIIIIDKPYREKIDI